MAVDNLLAALAGEPMPHPAGMKRVAVVDIGSNSTRLLIADVGPARRDASSSAARSSPASARASTRPAASARRRCSACSTCSTTTRRRSTQHGAERASPCMTSRRPRRRQRRRVRRARARALRPRRPHPDRRRGGAADVPRRDARARRDGEPLLVDRHRRRLDRARRRRARRVASTSRPRSASSATPSATCTTTRPRADELAALARDVREILGARPARARAGRARDRRRRHRRPSCAAIDLELEPYDPARVEGHVLMRATARDAARAAGGAAARGAPRDARPGPRPRADDRRRHRDPAARRCGAFGLDQVEVSEHDILLGAPCNRRWHLTRRPLA